MQPGPERPGAFAPEFRAELARLMDRRRDVRRFYTEPVEEAALTRCLDSSGQFVVFQRLVGRQ